MARPALGLGEMVDAAGLARPHRVIDMTARTCRCQSGEIATLVAIKTGKRSVQSRQIAADRRVVEARRRKRPLRMALATPRR